MSDRRPLRGKARCRILSASCVDLTKIVVHEYSVESPEVMFAGIPRFTACRKAIETPLIVRVFSIFTCDPCPVFTNAFKNQRGSFPTRTALEIQRQDRPKRYVWQNSSRMAESVGVWLDGTVGARCAVSNPGGIIRDGCGFILALSARTGASSAETAFQCRSGRQATSYSLRLGFFSAIPSPTVHTAVGRLAGRTG